MRFATQQVCRSLSLAVVGSLIAGSIHSAEFCLVAEIAVSCGIAGFLFRRQRIATQSSLHALLRSAAATAPRLPWPAAATLCTTGLVGFFLQSADRWWASSTLSKPVFASYALAANILTVASAGQAMVGTVLFPALVTSFSGGRIRSSLRLACKTTLILFGAAAAAALAGYLVVERFRTSFEGPFTAAFSIAPLLLITGIFRFSEFFSSALIVIGKERQLLVANIASFAIGALVWMSSRRLLTSNENLGAPALLGLCVTAAQFLTLGAVVALLYQSPKRRTGYAR